MEATSGWPFIERMSGVVVGVSKTGRHSAETLSAEVAAL
jgi:hypothetical protein